ncbi:MAG: DUF1294 domain-containing protein [Eubacteriales bacterium]
MHLLEIVVYYVICINLISIFMMFLDKSKAKKGIYRISEKLLLTIAILGGSLGTMIGMYVFHHKTYKKKFRYGIPAVIMMQCICIYSFIYLWK